MLNIAICDDNKYLCSITEEMVIAYKKKSAFEIKIEVFYSGQELIEYLKKEDKSGIEVASHKRNKFDDHMSKIVLIISKDGYE